MKKTYNIKGMHCNSCAINIEDELKDKVRNISVSFSKEKAEIDFDENKISENEIKARIKKLGYELFETDKITRSRENRFPWIPIIILGIIILIALFYFKIVEIPNIKIPELGEKTSLLLLFAAGLLTGFHCISMCGGFVLSYTSKNALKGYKGYSQHFIYGGAKVISYAIIGGIFGLIGGVFSFSIGLRGTIAILAGIFMIFYALGMFGLKFFRVFQIHPKFLTKISSQTSKQVKGQYAAPFVTGLLNGLFIACGPLQAMYLYAAGTGNFLTGATSLAVFGLGTLPIMFGFGSIITKISHETTAKILKISAIIVLILGLIMLNRGLNILGSPYSFESIKTSIINPININQTLGVNIVNGVQEINMEVSSSGYSPNSFVLKKGVPVKWNINVKQLTGCNEELVVNKYAIYKKLNQGLNVIEFTPDKEGTVAFTCGMGMLRGSFIITETGTANSQQIESAAPISTGSCSMGGGGSCGGSCGGGCGCGG
ncbi:MAG: sulfite exporter TauE/SafE family protein [Candidatus Nanoarchaeia archaeon]|nr:sulfite exporter TauE/SafE family protein [Candidatus Nanoarchaeia archaeon]